MNLAAALAAFEFEMVELAERAGVPVAEAKLAFCEHWNQALRDAHARASLTGE